MNRRLLPIALPIAVATLAALHSTAFAQQRKYENAELGYEIDVPDEWSEIPVGIDENWIVAKFLSKKSWISKGRDGNHEHRPLMTVIVFTDDATKFKGWAQEQRGNTQFVRVTELPYRDYRDYLLRNLENGYYFEREEERATEIAGRQVSHYEIAQHKSEPKKKLICWVFHGEDMNVAVEFEVLEDRVDRLRRECEQSLASFRFTREGRLAGDGPVTGGTKEKRLESNLWTKFRDEWKATPLRERERIRQAIEEERFGRIRAATPETWKIYESKHFLIVSHSDDRFAKRMTDAAEAFRSWCDKRFADLSDEYIRRGVLRVCADSAEYEAYRWKVSGDTWGTVLDDNREVVTYWDSYNGSSGRDAGFLFDDILEMYLADIDPLLLQYTPSWLRAAMHRYVTTAYLKGKKLEFDSDDQERVDLRELERAGKLRSLHELLVLDEETFWSESQGDATTARWLDSQVTNMFRFLEGPGQRHEPLRDFLTRYLAGVIAVAEDHRAQWDKEDAQPRKEAETEEEEEAMRKQDDDRWRVRRKQIHAEVIKRVLDLDDRQWERLDRAYANFVK